MNFIQFVGVVAAGFVLPAAAGIAPVIRGDFQLKILGPMEYLHGEKVTVKSGSDTVIYCFSTKVYPEWKTPAGSQAIHDRIQKKDGIIQLYGSFLILENATSSTDTGTYECSGFGYQTFYLPLEVTEETELPEYSVKSDIEEQRNSTEVPPTMGTYNHTWEAVTYAEFLKSETFQNRDPAELPEYFENNALDEQQNWIETLSTTETTDWTEILSTSETIGNQTLETETNADFLVHETTPGQDKFLVYKLQFLPFQEENSVEIEMGKSKTLVCSSWLGYPRWITPNNSKTRRHSIPLNVAGRMLYASYTNITRARVEDGGKYECAITNSSFAMTVHITGITCPKIEAKEYMEMSFSDGLNNGSRVSFKCWSPRKLYGKKYVTCKDNGKWSHSIPTCRNLYACDDIPLLSGGVSTYFLRNESADQELEDGGASSRSSRNARKLHTLRLPTNLHRVGTRVIHKCLSSYYKLTGSKVRRCLKGGKWSGKPASCDPICGLRNTDDSELIVNGDAEDSGHWPWQAAIFRYHPQHGWSFICGASLLNDLWVVTAAHCVTVKGTFTVLKPHYFEIYVGKYHRLNGMGDELMRAIKVSEVHVHPDYNPDYLDSDIALLRLSTSVSFSNQILPICLPTKKTTEKNLVVGMEGVFTGWGMNETGKHPDVLQQSSIPVSTNEICQKSFQKGGIFFVVTDNMFCAGRGYSDVCQGDSGGPMVFDIDYGKGKRWFLEGVVSFGSPKGCNVDNYYSGFTKVINFVEWIRGHL